MFEVYWRLLQVGGPVRQPHSVLLVDSHMDSTPSKALLLLTLLCGYLHDEPQLPEDSLSVIRGEEGGGEVRQVQVRIAAWSPGKGNGFGGLRGAELSGRAAERLRTLLRVLGWETSLSQVIYICTYVLLCSLLLLHPQLFIPHDSLLCHTLCLHSPHSSS
ncbi:hypothetical protein EON64_08665 [archaeon]|nr:MAG: hypothetical protein EON64_08665 [archaeon]